MKYKAEFVVFPLAALAGCALGEVLYRLLLPLFSVWPM